MGIYLGDSYDVGVDKVTHQPCAKGMKEKRLPGGAWTESGERSEERGQRSWRQRGVGGGSDYLSCSPQAGAM